MATQSQDEGFSLASLPVGDVLVHSESNVDPLVVTVLLPDGGTQPSGGTPVFAPRPGRTPTLSCGADSCAVCFVDYTGGVTNVSCRQLDANAAPVTTSTSDVGCCALANARPSVSVSAGRGVLAWDDAKQPQPTIYYSPLDSNGRVTRTDGFRLVSDLKTESRPATFDDGDRDWMAWQNVSGEVLLASVDRAGTLTDEGIFTGAAPSLSFRAAGMGIVTYVVDEAGTPRVRYRVLGTCVTPGACPAATDAGADAGTDAGDAGSDAGVAGTEDPPLGPAEGPVTLRLGCAVLEGSAFTAHALLVLALLFAGQRGSRGRTPLKR